MKNTSKAAKKHCLRYIKFHTGKMQKQHFSNANLFAILFEPPKAAWGISVKNNADALIFHTAICFWAKTNSYDGR